MKLFLFSFMLVLASSFANAGEGSSLDFLLSVSAGSVIGCEGLTAKDDKLRHVACNLGVAMKKAGLNLEQIEKVLEEAEVTVPKVDSICK